MMLAPTSKSLRIFRALRVMLHLVWGLFIASVLFFLTPVGWHKHLSQRWAQKMLRILGLGIRLLGDMPNLKTQGVVIISNHISWLDIWLIYAIRPVRFISKADVRDWPVIGWLAQRSGTLFIRRDLRRHTATINQQAAELLAQGDCIGLFPEGTTTDGRSLLPFHSSLFQAAVIHQAPVMMLAIRYHLADGTIDTAPAYHGGLSLLDSFRAVLTRQRIQVEVTALGILDTQGKTRREISLTAQTAIAKHLNLPVQHKKPETPVDPPAAAPSTAPPTDTPYPKPRADSPHSSPALTSDQK